MLLGGFQLFFFINELQFDQRIGNGLMTDFDRQGILKFSQRGIGSFRNDCLQEFVMGFEFWRWSGLIGSMEPVSRIWRLSLARKDCEIFHFSVAAVQVIPRFRSSKIRFRISVGIAFIAKLQARNQ